MAANTAAAGRGKSAIAARPGEGKAIGEKLRDQRRTLAERVKELECLFATARLSSTPDLRMTRVLPALCSAVKAAWQSPERTEVRIRARSQEARTRRYRESPWKMRAPLLARGRAVGSIEVCYLGEPPCGSAGPFLPAERRLLRAVAELAGTMLVRAEAERESRRAAGRLQERKRQLERKNIALREVLGQIEMEKRSIREQVAAEIDASILPLVRALARPGVPVDQRQRYAELADRALRDIAAAGARPGPGTRARLSPREAEVAELVRRGATSKEIARMLHVAEATVERHRHNIRRKSGIGGQKVNLVTFLSERG